MGPSAVMARRGISLRPASKPIMLPRKTRCVLLGRTRLIRARRFWVGLLIGKRLKGGRGSFGENYMLYISVSVETRLKVIRADGAKN